jgi:hypothetical protein
VQCQAISLRGERFCYFHNTFHKRHRYFRPNQATDPQFVYGRHVRLAPIEDRESIQAAISQTIGALSTGQIDLKAGVAVLYGLQLALQNMKELQAQPAPNPEHLVQVIVKTLDHLDVAPAGPEATVLEGSV